MTATTYTPLSESEHSAQLRKAVIASTIGTAIEWYDFFLYGTAAGLDLRQALLPQRRPAYGDACRLRHLFHRLRRPTDRRGDFRPLRRSHRPQGDADRDAAVHGHRDLPGRLCADLRVDRHLGRGDPDRPARCFKASASAANGAARCCWRWNGRAPTASAAWSPRGRNSACRAGCSWRIWRCSRSAPWSGDQFTGLGLAHSLRAFDHSGRRRLVDSPRHPRDAGVPASSSTRTRSRRRRSSKSSRSSRRRSSFRRLLRMSEQAPFYIFTAFIFAYAVGTLNMSRDFILAAVMVGGRASPSSPSRSPATSPTASAGARCI